MSTRLGLAIVTVVLLSGCINAQLRNNTVGMTHATGDVYQQEVMNNLAMFVYNPNSMPYFSYSNGLSSQVQNTAQGSITPTFGFVPSISSVALSATGTNLNNETLTLIPVNDPRKLELMRCAYQKEIAACMGNEMSQSCPDCKARLNTFYTGDKNGDIKKSGGGVVTTDCFGNACWFHCGCKEKLPKKPCECLAVGEYCGMYVWVDAAGRDELTKLTLAILDFAVNAAPVPLAKQVVYYIDQNGLPTTQREAVGTVSAAIQVGEAPPSLIYLDPATATSLEQALLSQKQELDREIDRVRALPEAENKEQIREYLRSLLDQDRVLKGKLEFLKRQLDAGALKHPYVPAESFGPPMGLLNLKTQLQGVSILPTP